MSEEKLYRASEWKEARRDHRMCNPQEGDYWYEDMFVPHLVVLKVLANHIIFCDKTKATDERHWTWDLSQPKMLSKNEFKEKVSKYSRLSEVSHYWAAEEFNKKQEQVA